MRTMDEMLDCLFALPAFGAKQQRNRNQLGNACSLLLSLGVGWSISFINYFLQKEYHSSVSRYVIQFVVISVLCWFCLYFREQIYRYRWFLGVFVFILCVILEIHGSSLGMWQQYFEVSEPGATPLFGIPRAWRSDEWAVQTPMAFSQGFSGYPYTGNIVRGTSTDMFIVYGQPVTDALVLFRFFHLGYLLLGSAKGLAFFWAGRFIFLFLVSLECGMVLTDKNKALSLSYALLVSLSPAIQWWFAINGFVEILLFGQAVLLLLPIYLKTRVYWKRLAVMLLIFFCMGNYLFVFYPAWQIPFAYIFFIMGLWMIRKHWYKKCVNGLDFLNVAICAALLLWALYYLFAKSSGTLSLVMNTAYPGARIETEGLDLRHLWTCWGTFLSPYTTTNLPGNQVEISSFIDLFPLGIILSLYLIFINKRKSDSLLVVLSLLALFFFWACFFSWPEWLAKITLFRFAHATRLLMAWGYLNILLLIRACSVLKRAPLGLSICLSILFCYNILFWGIGLRYGEYISGKFLLGVIATACVLYLLFLVGGRYRHLPTLLAVLLISLIAGLPVNPVEKGISSAYNTRISPSVQEIVHQNSDALWIVDMTDSWIKNNYLIMNGAPTINCTNVYPALERWELLDKEQSYRDIYNRYAHPIVNLTTDATVFQYSPYPDQFVVNLNVEDLLVLDVSYVMTSRALDDFNSYSNSVYFNEIYSDNEMKIYSVNS